MGKKDLGSCDIKIGRKGKERKGVNYPVLLPSLFSADVTIPV
jgi:hypothetical protein